MEGQEDAIARLANHANLPTQKDEQSLPIRSLLHQLWKAEKDQSLCNFDALFEDVLTCLAQLNLHFNGPDPNTRKGQRIEPIPLAVSYPVACIVSACLQRYRKWNAEKLFDQQSLDALLTGTNKIALAWEQLLASDITDLLEGFE